MSRLALFLCDAAPHLLGRLWQAFLGNAMDEPLGDDPFGVFDAAYAEFLDWVRSKGKIV
jgi:hypothetical protein